MTTSNRAKLEKYRYVLDNQSFTKIPGHTLQDVLDVIHEEFEPGYKVDWYCPHCVMNMVRYAFQEMHDRDTINVNLNNKV